MSSDLVPDMHEKKTASPELSRWVRGRIVKNRMRVTPTNPLPQKQILSVVDRSSQ